MRSQILARSALALAWAISGTAADAQSAEAQEASVDESATGGSEIITVTARKREEALQDVPVTITAVTGEGLQQRGINNLADLGAAVPGLKPQPHPSSSSIVQFQLRGQTAGDTLITVDQAVGVYLDDIYIARPRGLSAAFFDIGQVEVLKGPQGTLYGRNTTGGAINIRTRDADFDGVHGYAALDLGEYSLFQPRAAINIPLIENAVAVRLAAQMVKRDGFGRSVTTGQDIGQDRDQITLRGSVLAAPTETLRVRLKGEYYRSRENNTLYAPVYFNPQGGLAFQAAVELGGGPFLGPASFADPVFLAAYGRALGRLAEVTAAGNANPFQTFTQIPQRDDNDVLTLGGRIDFDLTDDVTLSSITGYRWFKSDQVFDLDGTQFQGLEVGGGVGGFPLSPGGPGSLSPNFTYPLPEEQVARFFSQEFNLAGTSLDDRLNWLLGAYYSRERARDVQSARVLPALTGISFLNDGFAIKNDSMSGFAQADFRFTEQFSVTGGLRYTKEQKGLTSRLATFSPATGVFTCGSGVTGPGNTPVTTTDPERAACNNPFERDFSGWSYLASVNFEPTDDILLFAKVAKGFRGGAFQLRAPTAAPAGPETATEYEIGLKSELFDRRLRANLGAFRTKYGNKQESIIITLPAGNLATVIQNAADATIKGFEGDFQLRPFEGLTLGATVAYIEGKYDRFPGALPISGGAPVDASGERFSLPPWSYALNGRYETPVFDGTMGFQLDYSWTDGARPNARQLNPLLPAAIIDRTVANTNGGSYANGRASLGLLNGRIDFRLPETGFDFAVWATNLTDKRYQYSGIDPSSAGLFAVIVGSPRMFGVTIRRSFGDE